MASGDPIPQGCEFGSGVCGIGHPQAGVRGQSIPGHAGRGGRPSEPHRMWQRAEKVQPCTCPPRGEMVPAKARPYGELRATLTVRG